MAGEQQTTTTETTTENKPPEWVTDLKATMTEVGKGIGTLVGLAQQSSQARQTPQPEPETDDGADVLDEVTLETLPRRAFAQRLLETFEGTLDKKLGPLTEAITKQATDLLTSNYVREAEAFAAKTKDFAEWSEEMQVIAKDNPDLAISRIYAIAKAENPAKAAEVAKKYAPVEPKTETRKAPLALSTQSQSGEVRNQKMNAEDASKAAWEETVAKFGGNPFE